MLLKIDNNLWNEFKRALGDIHMSLTAHQSVLNILNQLEQRAETVGSRRKPSNT